MNVVNQGVSTEVGEDGLGAEETQSEHIARDVLESLLEGCQVIDRDYRYVYLNQAALEHARRPKDQLLGRTMMECFPGIEQTSMFRMLESCMRETPRMANYRNSKR